MKEIKLTRFGKNKDKFVALVDDEDYEFLNQWEWYALKKGNTFYAQRNIRVAQNYTILSMHRTVMNTPINLQVDHIDHNGLNNQKSNLRHCTFKENIRNRTASGRSKYLGVTFNRKKYVIAQINHNKKHIFLGQFKTEEQAALAYNEAALKYFGEFANLNLI